MTTDTASNRRLRLPLMLTLMIALGACGMKAPERAEAMNFARAETSSHQQIDPARRDRAVAIAKKLGYEKALSLSGGMRAWREANLPIEKA